jgi:class 3 adenylate cyclase
LDGPGGTENDRQVARAPLHRVLRSAFAESGIPWATCRHAERHDGVLVAVPPSVATAAIVDRLIPCIETGIRRYNREAAPVRIQLRASLHVGPVIATDGGLTGQAIATASWLLNAPELINYLIRTNADLGVMVSSQVYETVIRHASGFADPTRYQEIPAEDSATVAWLCAEETRSSSSPRLYSPG